MTLSMERTMTIAERVCELSGRLSPEAQNELLDFAEFLSQKNRFCSGANTALQELQGGLEDSAVFAGLPTAIQERLRDEWD